MELKANENTHLFQKVLSYTTSTTNNVSIVVIPIFIYTGKIFLYDIVYCHPRNIAMQNADDFLNFFLTQKISK